MEERRVRTTLQQFVTNLNVEFGCLLALVAVFYFSTLRQGHIWADDFAMYVHHAQNIAEGRPYADTGYIYNPSVAFYGPRAYPPVFPLLLAPLCKFFGINLLPMKVEQVIFVLGTLTCVYLLWRSELGGYSLALIAILGFSPNFWAAKDDVTSDLPFLLFFYLTVLLVTCAPRHKPTWWRWAILVGLVLYLATGTRVVGVALVAGLVADDVLRRRTVTRFAGVALTVWLALMLLQRYFMGPGQGGYFDQLHPTPHTILANIFSYVRVLAAFWVASTRNAFSFTTLGIVALLTLAGVYLRYKRGLSMVETTLVPYFAILVLWPRGMGIRAMLPLLPWIAFLALSGLRGLTAELGPRYSTAAVCGLLLLISIPYAVAYRNTDFGPIRQESGLPEFNQLCQAVREHTGSADVLIFFRARALSLYTGRAASSFDYLGTESELWQWAEKIHASYLITTSAFDDDHGFLTQFVERYPSNLELIYQNPRFKLYRIRSFATPGGPGRDASRLPSQRLTPAGEERIIP